MYCYVHIFLYCHLQCIIITNCSSHIPVPHNKIARLTLNVHCSCVCLSCIYCLQCNKSFCRHIKQYHNAPCHLCVLTVQIEPNMDRRILQMVYSVTVWFPLRKCCMVAQYAHKCNFIYLQKKRMTTLVLMCMKL